MLANAKRIIKKWEKRDRHIIVNALDGKDSHTGHFVRVLVIKRYTPVILAGYLNALDDVVKREGATLRKTIRYASSDLKFGFSMKSKLQRLKRSIDESTELDPARQEELAARETIFALRDSQTSDDRKIVEIQTFLTISAPKLHQLEAAESSLKTWFDNMSGELDELKREQVEAMRQTSPAHDPYTAASEFFNKEHYGRITMDSVAARTYPMTSGTFSESDGIYFGRRTEDGGFCFINLCDPEDPRAQNLMVLGKTGQGKSFFLKALVVSLLDEGVHVFVFDLDGEWYDLCMEVGGTYIDHTTDEGRYFEPLTIMPAIKEIDKECVKYNRQRYSRAMNNGVRTASLLAGELNSQEVFEVGEAIKRVYKQAGIFKDKMETWNNPTGPRPTIHRMFAEIQEAAENNADAKSVFDKIKIYFIGIYNDLFNVEEPLSFENKAPLIVYRVGSGEEDENRKDESAKQAQIKMSMSFDVVDTSIHLLRIEGAHFSAVLVDEGQRQLKNPELRDYIFKWFTAIRKQNGMMILALNAPSVLLDTAEGVGMYENTNIRVYFYMEQSAVRELSSKVDLPQEIEERISGNEDTNCYILECHKKYDELIMHVPEEEARLYKTRGLKEAG
ncbi:DUF87 domain-containing protein [Paenibacillus lautus]|uniref:TraG/VirB4 family ATPase n=1 Tax=Paenibacillus lautus TaxID=1401 RepID=UPI003D26DC26